MLQRNQIYGLSTLVLATLLLLGLTRFLHPDSAIVPARWIFAWAGVESVLVFYGISWSLRRSDQAFYAIFGGGTLIRMASLGVVAYVLDVLRLPITVPLLALVGAYFVLSLIQLPFFHRLSVRRPA